MNWRFALIFLAFGVGAKAFAPTPKQVLDKINAGEALLLDVREGYEVASGRVRGSITFPTSRLGTKEWERFVKSLSKDKVIYTYCARGGRSDKVARELRRLGFQAENAGALNDLKKNGAEVK